MEQPEGGQHGQTSRFPIPVPVNDSASFAQRITGLFLAPILLADLFIAIFGWYWLHGPIERMPLGKTGRVLAITGDLRVKFGWPLPRIRAGAVALANSAWATEKQMVAAGGGNRNRFAAVAQS
jgi:hypothetical protein